MLVIIQFAYSKNFLFSTFFRVEIKRLKSIGGHENKNDKVEHLSLVNFGIQTGRN